ncbi:MAG: hypothetical protein R8N24_02100 [Alphaproteobacteria bacterium]|nr:hypothetical protein [Alphaproteobacteria bacterium]
MLKQFITTSFVFTFGVITTVNSASLDNDFGNKLQTISTLENDILILDTEIAKCEKSKKGWVAATVIGSAGVVATGVAAGVQGAKIKDKKAAIEQGNSDVKTLNTTLQGYNNDK